MTTSTLTRRAVTNSEDWQQHMLCIRALNPDLWHPISSRCDDSVLARRICGQCPVRIPCRDAKLRRAPFEPHFGEVEGGWIFPARGKKPVPFPDDKPHAAEIIAEATS